MRKVAIIRRNGFGDLLLAYPLLAYLKKEEPTAHITLFVEERNAPLLPFLPPWADRYVVIPKKNKYLTHLKVALKEGKNQFDLAISMKTSPMKLMNVFLFCLRAKKRVAYVEKGKWHSHLVNAPQYVAPEILSQRHQALKGMHLLNPEINEIAEEFYPQISIPQQIATKWVPLLTCAPPYLLLSASTTNAANRMEASKYADIVNRLARHFSFSTLIVSEKKDEKRAVSIASYLKTPYQIYFPRHFEEFMVLLNLADLYFVGDSGVAHIGSGLNKKLVVLFGSTHPLQWGPLNKETTSFYHPQSVNYIDEAVILDALLQKSREVFCGRDD